MSKTAKLYIAILVLFFIGAIIIEFSKPKPINWQPTYNETHKIPFGTYILYNELPTLFPKKEQVDIDKTPYEFFEYYTNYNDSILLPKSSFIHIDLFLELDKVSAEALLRYAKQGHTVLISSNYFPEIFEDSLGFKTKNKYVAKDDATLSFFNPELKTKSITIEKGLSNISFTNIDKTTTTVLGKQTFNDEAYINFIKIDYGKGNVLLHTQPTVFTNYHLLKNNHRKYASALLSYLEGETIYYNIKNKDDYTKSRSPMRFILSQPTLKWAWYLGLITLFLFIIFNAKRKQRIVPIIKPLKNTTVDFTKTIGNLYFETKDHNNLIDKKITYFLEHLRRTYYVDTQHLNEKFIKNLALKTNKPINTVKQTINTIATMQAKKQCNETDLITLNKRIEAFYSA